MTRIREVSVDDDAGVADAIRRRASDPAVRLVWGGVTVAEIVPPPPRDPSVPADCELTADELAALEARAALRPMRDADNSHRQAERFGAPTLQHYRDVYRQIPAPWPGEDFIRRHYPVADNDA